MGQFQYFSIKFCFQYINDGFAHLVSQKELICQETCVHSNFRISSWFWMQNSWLIMLSLFWGLHFSRTHLYELGWVSVLRLCMASAWRLYCYLLKLASTPQKEKKDCVIFHSWRVLNKPPTLLSPPSSMPENKEAPRGLNRAFTVITVVKDIKKWFIIRVQQKFSNMQTT